MSGIRLPSPIALVTACAVAAGASAQTELDNVAAHHIRDVQAQGQGVLLPLDGALDPQPAPVEAQISVGTADVAAPPEAGMVDDIAGVVAETPAAALSTPPAEPEEGALTGGPTEEPEPTGAVIAFADIEGLVDAEFGDPASIGPFRLWLATSGTQQESKAQWRDIASNNRDLLQDLRAIIVVKELGDEGTYFRLQAGPLPSESAAAERCAALAARSLYCVVLGPDDA